MKNTFLHFKHYQKSLATPSNLWPHHQISGHTIPLRHLGLEKCIYSEPPENNGLSDSKVLVGSSNISFRPAPYI